MRLLLRNGFILASTVFAGTCGAEPALAQDVRPDQKIIMLPDRSKSREGVRYKLPSSPEDRLFLEPRRLEDFEKRYREQRFGKDVEIAEGVYGSIKPVGFRLTFVLGPSRK